MNDHHLEIKDYWWFSQKVKKGIKSQRNLSLKESARRRIKKTMKRLSDSQTVHCYFQAIVTENNKVVKVV